MAKNSSTLDAQAPTAPEVDYTDAMSAAFTAASVVVAKTSAAPAKVRPEDVALVTSLIEQQAQQTPEKGDPAKVWLSVRLPGASPEEAEKVFASHMRRLNAAAKSIGFIVRRRTARLCEPNELQFHFFEQSED